MDKDLLSLAQAAELLGVTRTAVLKMVNRGRLHARRIGRAYIVTRQDVMEAAGVVVGPARRKLLEGGVHKTVKEYEEVLRKLGKG